MRHPRWGFEFDWLAVDILGCVAVLNTVGMVEVPGVVDEAFESVDVAVELLDGLPAVGDASGLLHAEPDGDWLHPAKRGLYMYEGTEPYQPYLLRASPTQSIHITDLPEPIRSVAELVTFNVSFQRTDLLTLDLIVHRGPGS